MRADLRREITLSISNFDYQNALTHSSDLVKISKRLFFHFPALHFYAYAVDCMLMIKCQIRNQLIQHSEESLL